MPLALAGLALLATALVVDAEQGAGHVASGGATVGLDDEGDATDTVGPISDVPLGSDDGANGSGCRKVDFLFVVDDSGSMISQQAKLTAAFPGFMEAIDDILVQRKGVDYHVGVVSPEMAGPEMCVLELCAEGNRGRLLHEPDRIPCSAEPEGRWIETGPVERVAQEFECIASIAALDFAEMPLEAARAALSDRITDAEGYNAGFLREDALLVLVIVSDEDDQSRIFVPESWDILFGPGPMTPVSTLYQSLVSLKGGDPDAVVVVALTGDRDTGCDNEEGEVEVAAAPRVHELLDLATPNSYWGDLCGDALGAPLQDALEVIAEGCAEFVPPAG